MLLFIKRLLYHKFNVKEAWLDYKFIGKLRDVGNTAKKLKDGDE